MFTLLLVIQILLAVSIVTLVLLQHGKGADAGAAFGSGASSTVFGARGSASFLTRATAVLVTLFFVNSLLLASDWLIPKTTREPASVAERLTQPPTADGGEQDAVQADSPGEQAPAMPEDVPDLPAAPADDLPQ